MDPDRPLLIPVGAPGPWDEKIVGGKAARIESLAHAGFRVPRGLCITAWAYETFLHDSQIGAAIGMELGRKSMADMRWEEIWDAALRIRAMFLAQPLSDLLRETLADGLSDFAEGMPLAVRSSAIGEDSAGRSFAGLHESIVGVRGKRAVEDAVRLVWASLWSDAALLYRKELGLNPMHSRMAVLVQEMVDADRSGVAFARDPRDPDKESALIESVPGPCSLLVDGLVDPDRWELDRRTRDVIVWLPGQRDEKGPTVPLLERPELEQILETLLSVERLFGWSPDMEWTGTPHSLTVLQARPITHVAPDEDAERGWYLSLRPGDERLKQLRLRVAEQLIPELEAAGQAYADEKLDRFSDKQLADTIEKRNAAVVKWKQIYWDDFIPFAHGVRRLATYYNDSVQPEDPYEFVGLVRNQPLLASRRNLAIGQLAKLLADKNSLRSAVESLLPEGIGNLHWPAFRDELVRIAVGAEDFLHRFDELRDRFLDVAFDEQRLCDAPEPLLRNIIQLSKRTRPAGLDYSSVVDTASALERRLLGAVGSERQVEALDIIETARISWKLRDDDNLLVARLESQLLRALEMAATRLRDRGRLSGRGHPSHADAESLVEALRDRLGGPITLESDTAPQPGVRCDEPGQTPRQLIGQPASPGIASGAVRCVSAHSDLGRFRQDEILVCDAIQPTMTHLVPLAGAIVERRGGMLIHGAIIARELGIPCVNGVRQAANVLRNGDFVTVDGHLGIVTVGPPEFDLELPDAN